MVLFEIPWILVCAENLLAVLFTAFAFAAFAFGFRRFFGCGPACVPSICGLKSLAIRRDIVYLCG